MSTPTNLILIVVCGNRHVKEQERNKVVDDINRKDVQTVRLPPEIDPENTNQKQIEYNAK